MLPSKQQALKEFLKITKMDIERKNCNTGYWYDLRIRRVLEGRMQGKTFKEIGKTLVKLNGQGKPIGNGVGQNQVSIIYQKALKQINKSTPEILQQLEYVKGATR